MVSILPVLGSWSSSVFNQLDCGSFIDAEWFYQYFQLDDDEPLLDP